MSETTAWAWNAKKTGTAKHSSFVTMEIIGAWAQNATKMETEGKKAVSVFVFQQLEDGAKKAVV